MRLIDADVLTERLNNAIECGRRVDMPTLELEAVLVDVQNAPSIDIVFCKECRHWEMRNSPRGWCVVHQGYVSPQYFCADGEREGE